MTVYVMGCDGSRLVKIGHSGDPVKRLKEISGWSPQVVRLLWQSTPEYGEVAERKLHTIFQVYRQRGEWFDFGHADPAALIAAAIDLPTPPPSDRIGDKVVFVRKTPVKRPVARRPVARVVPPAAEETLTLAEQAMLPHGYAVGEEFGPPYIGAWD